MAKYSGKTPFRSLNNRFVPSFGMNLFFVLLLSVILIPTSKADCEFLQNWKNANEALAKGRAKISERAQLLKEERVIRDKTIQDIFNGYLNETLKISNIETCLGQSPERQNFINTMNSIFYERTLQNLGRAKAPRISAFLKLLGEKFSDSLPLFRLTGHYKTEKDGDTPNLPGGFHRASGSVFMNISKIPSNDWTIIFIHELLHSLDEELWKAVEVYGHEDWIKEFEQWASKTENFDDLPADTQGRLTQWIEAGLSRGFWGEWRAWTVSFAIYKQGLQEGLWKNIKWIDEILEKQKADEPLEQFTYRFLDPRFKNPSDGFFKSKLMQNAVEKIREQYGPGKKLPPLGNLQAIIDAK